MRRALRSAARGALLALGLLPSALVAQGVERVALAEVVDTVSRPWNEPWRGAVPAIYRAWREYLLAGRGTPEAASRWIEAERLGLPVYDLTTVPAPSRPGLSAIVLDVQPAPTDTIVQFVVRTLLTRGSGTGAEPVAAIRVYAVQEGGRWVFANALPRLTAQWPRADVAQISYVIAPDGRFDRFDAEDFAAFADSVAARFDVPRLPRTLYYFADDAEQLHRAMGVDWVVSTQTVGYPLWQDHLLLSGSAAFAEADRHDVVHMLLAQLGLEGRTHPIVAEGVATWLGGAQGSSFDALMRDYANHLRGNPTFTIETALAGPTNDAGWYPAGAILALLVYEKGGFPAVRELYTSGATDAELKGALSRILGTSWGRIVARARERILELSEAN